MKRLTIDDLRLTIGVAASAVVGFLSVQAATNGLTDPEEIPPLRPPKPEILPGFWEQNWVWVLFVSLAALLTLILVLRILLRPKPPVVLPPATVARQALRLLKERAEDAALLAEVSATLRRYFTDAFSLPNEELTNSELCEAMRRQGGVDDALATAVADLMQGMEHRRFNPEANADEANIVRSAVELIDQAEDCQKAAKGESAPGTAAK